MLAKSKDLTSRPSDETDKMSKSEAFIMAWMNSPKNCGIMIPMKISENRALMRIYRKYLTLLDKPW